MERALLMIGLAPSANLELAVITYAPACKVSEHDADIH